VLINCTEAPEVLDQGQEGACTGFALAAVINFLLRRRNITNRYVSPRMLYEMARRYDQWPGENYEGSSARGAMIGWVRHGVCSRSSWSDDAHGAEHLTQSIANEAIRTPGGAFYRVQHRNVRDMQAALVEVGALYCTLMVHAGWDQSSLSDSKPITYVDRFGNLQTQNFPVIPRLGRADGGHAVAIVGYTPDGFIIQNSWGTSWGSNGFALLPYVDYILHTTDVWAVQLGVPVTINLWEAGYADTTEGVQRASATIPLTDIRPYVIDIGNNGRLSDSGNYWTTEEDLERLFSDDIPKQTADWPIKRIMLYVHGGLNDENAVAKRVVAFRDVCLENEIYPLHVMWESGVWESLKSIIQDQVCGADQRAGGWLDRFREGLVEAKDRTFELTVAYAGSKLWGEMKENAQYASTRADGGIRLLARNAKEVLGALTAGERGKWELHVVGHSAGSIVAAHAIPEFVNSGIAFKTLQFMAPAIRTDAFVDLVVPAIRSGTCPKPSMYILSEQGELDDELGPYGKSLLYLVSNAFEGARGLPLLGMQRFLTQPGIAGLFDRARLVIAGQAPADSNDSKLWPNVSRSDTHGGFDNDPATMNSVLYRILGNAPLRPFSARDLDY
jgi:hypothetical protein